MAGPCLHACQPACPPTHVHPAALAKLNGNLTVVDIAAGLAGFARGQCMTCCSLRPAGPLQGRQLPHVANSARVVSFPSAHPWRACPLPPAFPPVGFACQPPVQSNFETLTWLELQTTKLPPIATFCGAVAMKQVPQWP